jgi:hypothetical protein
VEHRHDPANTTCVTPGCGQPMQRIGEDVSEKLGALGDALHAISCATGYNLRWLLRAISRLGIGPPFLRLLLAASQQPRATGASCSTQMRSWTTRVGRWFAGGLVKKFDF